VINDRYGCDHNDHDNFAYARIPKSGVPICRNYKTDLCFTDDYFSQSSIIRSLVAIHECSHRIGLSVGSKKEIYDTDRRFRFLDRNLALVNSDSFALFVGAVADVMPIPLFKTLIFGLGGGIYSPITNLSTVKWEARFYFGKEYYHPVLGIFNPTLGVGLSVIGDPVIQSSSGIPSNSTSFLLSLLAGLRLTNPRPGLAGAPYISIYGGPAISFSNPIGIGTEAFIAGGYRWRLFDISANIGYRYDPREVIGNKNELTGSIGISFVLPEPGDYGGY